MTQFQNSGASRGMCKQTADWDLRRRRGGRQCFYEACGIRLRDFPLTLYKVLAASGGKASG